MKDHITKVFSFLWRGQLSHFIVHLLLAGGKHCSFVNIILGNTDYSAS